MEEEEADLRWVKDQLGHASIVETEAPTVLIGRHRHFPFGPRGSTVSGRQVSPATAPWWSTVRGV